MDDLPLTNSSILFQGREDQVRQRDADFHATLAKPTRR